MSGVVVSIGDGRRPEATTVVRLGPVDKGAPAGSAVTDRRMASARRGGEPADGLASFEGPLALLLSLIEARQLDVLTVPLGGLARAYLDAISGLEGERLPHLSAFVTVAAQLIVIKSRALLPHEAGLEPVMAEDEGSDPEAELRRRLIVYRAYRDAGEWLGTRAAAWGPLVRREPGVAQAAGLAGARPGDEPPFDPALLVAALQGAAHLAPPAPPPPEVVRRTVTLAERAAVIREALRAAPAVVLQDLIGGSGDRVVATVTFLAMLELVKRREIVVAQDRPWGPIRCAAVERPGGGDEAPLGESLGGFG